MYQRLLCRLRLRCFRLRRVSSRLNPSAMKLGPLPAAASGPPAIVAPAGPRRRLPSRPGTQCCAAPESPSPPRPCIWHNARRSVPTPHPRDCPTPWPRRLANSRSAPPTKAASGASQPLRQTAAARAQCLPRPPGPPNAAAKHDGARETFRARDAGPARRPR